MQRRLRQMQARRLQGTEAVVERQQRVTPERDDRCLFSFGQRRRVSDLRPGLQILHC